jgi:hypothetical protein
MPRLPFRSKNGHRRRRPALIIAVPAIVVSAVIMRLRGYPMGGDVVVRCRRGHLFTTIWVPFASVKAIKLGWWRLQRCPVGNHWSLVNPVKESDLTEEERAEAQAHRDIRLP